MSVGSLVRKPYRLRLYRDAALSLDVHVVEDLVLHLALFLDVGVLDEPVGKSRLAVVDVCDDAEVTYVLLSFVHLCPNLLLQ